MLRLRRRYGSTVCADDGETGLLSRVLPEAPKVLGKRPRTDTDRNFFIFVCLQLCILQGFLVQTCHDQVCRCVCTRNGRSTHRIDAGVSPTERIFYSMDAAEQITLTREKIGNERIRSENTKRIIAEQRHWAGGVSIGRRRRRRGR